MEETKRKIVIQDLSDKVWANHRLHEVARSIDIAWLKKELNLKWSQIVTEALAIRAIEAAAILACSKQMERRRLAFRIATNAFELFEESDAPFDAALRVVLTRLGNFPSTETRPTVNSALSILPWTLATEELRRSDARTITINDRNIRLTNFQFGLWNDLVKTSSVALSAPTSAGKSFVLQNYIVSKLNKKNCNIVYIVPTRALIAQVSFNLINQSKRQDQVLPDIITVPLGSNSPVPEKSVFVMTQERIHLLLNAHPSFTADLVVVDEAHSIADGSRGILLHTVIEELLSRSKGTQVLFASPTIRNLDVFERIFGIERMSRRLSKETTVAQNFIVVKSDGAQKGHLSASALGDLRSPIPIGDIPFELSLRSKVQKLAHIPVVLGRGHPNLIYANGPDEAERTALQIASHFSGRKPSPEQSALSRLVKESVHGKFALSECVLKGVGFHYSNIPTIARQGIETAFTNGALDFLVSTSTLLQGVNLPARNIFMLNPTKGQNSPLDSTDFWNLSGRAGRLRQEFQGNIFLIDYEQWAKRPLSGPKDANIIPAIETAIKLRHRDLIDTIQTDERKQLRKQQIDLDTAFVRLFIDLKQGLLTRTLQRAGINANDVHDVRSALETAAKSITLPAHVLRQTPNVSAHKQQQLYLRLRIEIESNPKAAIHLVPLRPEEPRSFDSYASILRLCHEVILGYDTSRNRHRFHAVMAWQWMRGWPIPKIIDRQIKRQPTVDVRKVIRSTLEVIENEIRFQTVRLFGCYNAILKFALIGAGASDLVENIPDLALYLEIGASNRTMVSFIALGLSRATAIRLNGWCSDQELEMDIAESLRWLRRRDLDKLELPELLLAELKAMLENNLS